MELFSGENNPNYGNTWSVSKREAMADDIRRRRDAGRYGAEWKRKIGLASTRQWEDAEKREQMAKSVAKAKQKYRFYQYDRLGGLLKVWDSVEEIISENPSWKWQNIYSACNGYKPTYMGSVWRKELKNETV